MNILDIERFILELPRSFAQQGSYPKGQLNQEIVKQGLQFLGVDLSPIHVIHVAGTNGKGSVCTKIAYALAFCGYHVGLFTSPHLLSVRERIATLQSKRAGVLEIISCEMLDKMSEKVLCFFRSAGIPCTFFDFLTLLALLWFHTNQVDFIVCEAGIGGRYDSTNVFEPLVSVITSISFDHQELLGSTLEDIAWHKAGIMQPNTTVVLGPRVHQAVFFDAAKQLCCKIYQPHECFSDYEKENQATALQVLSCIQQIVPLQADAIAQGILQVPRGRFERLNDEKNIQWILDVGHNQEGIEFFLQRVEKELALDKFLIFFSIAHDKDYQSILPILLSRSKMLFLAKPLHPRLLDPSILQAQAKKQDFQSTIVVQWPQQIDVLRDQARRHDMPILACGSFLFIAELIKNLR